MKPFKKKNDVQSLQKIICLFEGIFSIDWVMAMTDLKPSAVLIELENAIQEGWLKQAGVGQFSICDFKKKEYILSLIGVEEKEHLFRTLVRFFLDEYLQNDLDITQVAGFLLKIINDEEGCRGLLLAGDAFVRIYQPEKALECYAKLKSDLLRLKGETVDDLFIDMAIKYSKVSTARQSTTEVLQTLEDAMARAVRKNDRASQALIQMHIAKNEWLLNRYDKALKIFTKGWILANQCKDAKLLRAAISFKTFFSFWQGRYKEVISHYENSISEVDKYPQSGFPLLVTITVGQCYTYVGQLAQGLGMLDSLQTSCIEAGDLQNAAFSDASINTALLMSESAEKTLGYVKKTYDKIQQSENHYIGLLAEGFLAYLYYLKGDLAHSVSFLKKFVKKCQNVNIDILHHRPYVLELCWAMEQGEYPRILDLSLEKEVKKLILSQNVFLKGLAYRYKALLEIQTGCSQAAIMKSLALSLQWLEESGHDLEILKTRLELLRRYLIVNDQKHVKKQIQQIGNRMSQYHPDLIPSDLRALLMEKSSALGFLKSVFSVGSEIMTISDSKDLIPKILSTVNQLTGAERGAMFLLNKDEKVSLKASKNLTHEQVMEPGFKSSMKLIEQVIAGGVNQKPVVQNDLESLDGGIRSCICVPIIFKGKIMGALYHDNRLLHSVFQESDFEWLSFFVAQVALAVDNINAHEHILHLEQKIQDEKRYAQEQYYPIGRFKDVIGKSDAVRRMLFLVEQVASTDSKVLILGETGVGKELVANAIHYQSVRKNRPFIKANCSALTETLINSELFGHERGAFSGANQRRIGRFEMADGGTIFLDEIGDLPLSVQVNLLRVLQNKKFERVGGNETIQSNFRLIAATNHDLHQLVREKKFREDLYFRLNVFPIHVPPLRERKEDIPLLVHHFIQRISKKMNKEIKKVPAKEMNKLISHSWPGNIRELENAIERGIVLNSTAVFKAADLDRNAWQHKMPPQVNSLEENERNHILWALEQKNWKVRGPGGVAEFLDIHPSTLTARMKKLGVKRAVKFAGEN